MGTQNCVRDPNEILKESIQGGITAFQFREKGEGSFGGQEKLELGRRLRKTCKENNILFFVNDDVHLIELLDADGIHVGQSDTSVKEIRKKFPQKLIGLSVSNSDELARSPIDLVDYVGAGPIFPTKTKADVKVPVGTDWIKKLRSKFPLLPIVGIGGINTENAISVIEAGADGVSFISVVTMAENVRATVQKLSK